MAMNRSQTIRVTTEKNCSASTTFRAAITATRRRSAAISHDVESVDAGRVACVVTRTPVSTDPTSLTWPCATALHEPARGEPQHGRHRGEPGYQEILSGAD